MQKQMKKDVNVYYILKKDIVNLYTIVINNIIIIERI